MVNTMNRFCKHLILLVSACLLSHCSSILQQQQDVDAKLITACKNGDARRAEQLLHLGADANAIGYTGETPLGTALIKLDDGRWKRHADGCVRVLLHAGADPNHPHRHTTPLHLAVGTGKTDVVDLLLRHGADPNAETRSSLAPIWMATYKNDSPMAGLLLQHGANPNARDELGRTPLQFLQEKGHKRLRLMQTLRQYGGK